MKEKEKQKTSDRTSLIEAVWRLKIPKIHWTVCGAGKAWATRKFTNGSFNKQYCSQNKLFKNKMTPKYKLNRLINIQKRSRNTVNHNKHKCAQNNKMIRNRRKICSHLKIKRPKICLISSIWCFLSRRFLAQLVYMRYFPIPKPV